MNTVETICWCSKITVVPLCLPCALRSSAGWALPRRSFSAPRSWHTGPSSWCIRHCGGPQSGCTLRLSAPLVRLVMHGSHTSPPHYCTGKDGKVIKTSMTHVDITMYFVALTLQTCAGSIPAHFLWFQPLSCSYLQPARAPKRAGWHSCHTGPK